jgi:NADH dehydrogenase
MSPIPVAGNERPDRASPQAMRSVASEPAPRVVTSGMKETKPIDLDIAILGGGFAGVYCAKEVGRKLGRRTGFRIGLISDRNYMVFQPLLPEVIGGSVSPRHVVNPLRLLCRGVEVFRGEVENISWPERQLILNAGDFTGNAVVRFSHLVLAPGAHVNLRMVPGMPEHALLMRNAGDALHLRSTIISRIEEANLENRPAIRRRLLTFVVVGGGYSGVETAGQILDVFQGIHGYYGNVSREDLNVWLVHGRSRLLPTMTERLAEFAAHQLRERGLRLLLGERVKSITAGTVRLESGGTIETNTVVSTIGNAPHPLVTALCEDNRLPTEKGRILTSPTM